MTDLLKQVDGLLNRLKHHMERADHWDAKVAQRRQTIKRLYLEAGLNEVQTRRKFEVDYDLNDYLAEYRQHCSEVQRCSAMIQGLVAAHQLLSASPSSPLSTSHMIR